MPNGTLLGSVSSVVEMACFGSAAASGAWETDWDTEVEAATG